MNNKEKYRNLQIKLSEKDFDLIDLFKAVEGDTQAKKLRSLISTFYNEKGKNNEN